MPKEYVMWPTVLPGLITGGASLLGNMFSSNQSAQNVEQQIAAQEQMQGQSEQYNAQQAAINRQFQAQQVNEQDEVQRQNMTEQQAYETQMSNTAYQRAANDMKRAGLNPMMMFGSGGAASTPSVAAAGGASAGGAQASVGTPSVPLSQRQSPFAGVGDAVNKAISTALQLQSQQYDVQKKAADTRYADAAADVEKSRKFGIELDNQEKSGGPGAGPTERGIAEANIQQARATDAKNTALRAQHEYDARNTELGKRADQSSVFVKPLGEAVGVASDIAQPFVSSAVRKQGMDLLREKMNRSQYRHTETFDDEGNLVGSQRSQSGYNQ